MGAKVFRSDNNDRPLFYRFATALSMGVTVECLRKLNAAISDDDFYLNVRAAEILVRPYNYKPDNRRGWRRGKGKRP